MVVKRDCIHHHYVSRHSNPDNDDFSLERFLLTNAKINKHKRPKVNIRKPSEKKIIANENINSVTQKITTEFIQEEFEIVQEINQANVEQENEIQYINNECNINLPITSCSPSTSSGVNDRNLKLCTRSLVHYADHKINDIIIEDDNKQSAMSLINISVKPESNKVCLAIVNKENNIDCLTNSNELDNNSQDSNKQTKSSLNLNFINVLNFSDSINDKSDISKNNKLLLQKNKERTKFTTNLTCSSNLINNEHLDNNTNCKQLSTLSIDFNKEAKLASSIKCLDVTNNICSKNTNTFGQSSNKKCSNVSTEENKSNDKIINNLKLVCCQLPLSNKKQKPLTSSERKYSNVTNDKSSNGFDIIEDINEIIENPEIEFSKSASKLQNNEIQSQFSLSNKCPDATNNKHSNNIDMNNENYNSNSTSFDQSSMSFEGGPKFKFFHLSIGCNGEAYIPSLNHIPSDNEENYDIDDCKNIDHSFSSELQYNEETDSIGSDSRTSSILSDDFLNDYDKSLNRFSYNDENTKSTPIDFMNGITNNSENVETQSLKNLSDTCDTVSDSCVLSDDELSNESSDIEEDANSSKIRYFDYVRHGETFNDSIIVNNRQSIICLREIKSTNINTFSNCVNCKQFNDPIINNDKSVLGISFGVLNHTFKSNETCLFKCVNCNNTVNDTTDNYRSIDPNFKVKDLINPGNSCATIVANSSVNSFIPVISNAQNANYHVNNFTPISSSAQIINNTIITASVEEYELMNSDDCDHYIKNSSNCVTYTQQFPRVTKNLNEHAINPLTDQPKPIENIFNRNVTNGSILHMDKDQVMSNNHKKTIVENESKTKPNLKRSILEQIDDGKENHNQYSIGSSKKQKIEILDRQELNSKESDNNDNVE